MQHLAMTCKTLYDKDYLDNMMLLKEKEKHPVIIFKDIFTYFSSVKRFQIKIKTFVSDTINNDEIWRELKENIDNITDHHLFIKNLRDVLIKELLSITKQKEKNGAKKQQLYLFTLSRVQ